MSACPSCAQSPDLAQICAKAREPRVGLGASSRPGGRFARRMCSTGIRSTARSICCALAHAGPGDHDVRVALEIEIFRRLLSWTLRLRRPVRCAPQRAQGEPSSLSSLIDSPMPGPARGPHACQWPRRWPGPRVPGPRGSLTSGKAPDARCDFRPATQRPHVDLAWGGIIRERPRVSRSRACTVCSNTNARPGPSS